MASEQAKVLVEIDVGDHLDDDVDAAAARGGENVGGVVGRAVIERVVRALFEDERPTAFRTRRGQHRHAHGAGDLDGGDADAATPAVDEQGLARPPAGTVDE